MHYFVTEAGIEIEDISDFSLHETLTCGQCFRWKKIDNSTFQGVAFGKAIKISQTNTNSLFLQGVSKKEFLEVWKNYFDLDFDYFRAKQEISKHNDILKEACEYAPGIRILRQDPFEALCSFILSQNNNIPRIEGIVRRLCESFGDRISDDEWSFPSLEKLSSLTEQDLAPIRSGFRAKYLIDAVEKVANGEIDFDELKELPLDEARAKLMQIRGVGPKVADCTLLYGLHRLDAFPKDVWIKRVMEKFFPEDLPEQLKPIAGLAQQYLFHYSRKNPQIFE